MTSYSDITEDLLSVPHFIVGDLLPGRSFECVVRVNPLVSEPPGEVAPLAWIKALLSRLNTRADSEGPELIVGLP